MRRGVVAHQLDPEPARAVARHVQGEQSAVSETELAVSPDQHEEHQNVPQQFVEERRVDHGGHLAGRHTVEGVHVHHSRRVLPVEDLHSPWNRGLPAVELLVEVVAQSAYCLGQHDARSDGVPEGRQRNAPPPARDPSANPSEGHRAPDAQAALPNTQGRRQTGTAGSEVGLPVGHEVVDPPTDQAERHRPQRDVVDDAALAPTGRPAAVA